MTKYNDKWYLFKNYKLQCQSNAIFLEFLFDSIVITSLTTNVSKSNHLSILWANVRILFNTVEKCTVYLFTVHFVLGYCGLKRCFGAIINLTKRNYVI